MRVLLITDADVFAGTEAHILTLATSLQALGVAVAIASPPGSPLERRASEANIATFSVPKGRPLDAKPIKVLAELLRKRHVNLIHAHNGRSTLLAAAALGVAGCGSLVATQHFIRPSRATRRGILSVPSRLAHGWLGRRVQQWIAISQAARREMIRRWDAPPSRVTCIWNGIKPLKPAVDAPAIRRTLGVPDKSPLIACLARLRPEKDVPLLVRAMAKVIRVFPDARCVIAGEGPEHGNILGIIEELKLQESVQLLGFRDDVASILGASDLLALPSPAEPFGLVLLEAMASAKPVVAIAAGGPLEIVDNGITGILSKSCDVEAFATAIINVLSNRGGTMGTNGRRRFHERFTAEQMAISTLDVYEKAIAVSRASRW